MEYFNHRKTKFNEKRLSRFVDLYYYYFPLQLKHELQSPNHPKIVTNRDLNDAKTKNLLDLE